MQDWSPCCTAADSWDAALRFEGRVPALNRLTRPGRIGPCPLSQCLPSPSLTSSTLQPHWTWVPQTPPSFLPSRAISLPLLCGHHCPVHPSDLSNYRPHVLILELLWPVACSSLSRQSRPWRPSPPVFLHNSLGVLMLALRPECLSSLPLSLSDFPILPWNLGGANSVLVVLLFQSLPRGYLRSVRTGE